MELGGMDPLPGMDGRSLVPVIRHAIDHVIGIRGSPAHPKDANEITAMIIPRKESWRDSFLLERG